MGWWETMLEEHRQDGREDANKGVYEPYWPINGDPQNEAENEAYKEGFNQRRRELGEKFQWRE